MIDFPAWEKHKQKKAYPAVVTPLMDIMFLLLLFFILTSSLPAPVLPVNLGKAESAAVSDKKNILIVIMSDGTLEIDGNPVTDTAMMEYIKQKKTDDREIVLAVDRLTPFHFAAAVMDRLRTAGIDNVSLMMESPDE